MQLLHETIMYLDCPIKNCRIRSFSDFYFYIWFETFDHKSMIKIRNSVKPHALCAADNPNPSLITFLTQTNLMHFIHHNSFNTMRTIFKNMRTSIVPSHLSKLMSHSIRLLSNKTDLTVMNYLNSISYFIFNLFTILIYLRIYNKKFVNKKNYNKNVLYSVK
jgi:hypothetical protein